MFTLKISYSFSVNFRIRANWYHYTLLTFTLCSLSWSLSYSSSGRDSMAERLCCRSLVIMHFRVGCSSYSVSSSFCWLSSILTHFFQVFIEKLLFMTIQQLCYIFSTKHKQSGLLCHTANVFNNVLHWHKYCEFVQNGGDVCPNLLSNTSLTLPLKLCWWCWCHSKWRMNATDIWPTQNSHHLHEI